jgi:precorrin-6A/cobalt-precorrin-6A reductase
LIWIIGGTSEAAELAGIFSKKTDVIITVATPVGEEFLQHGQVKIGRLTSEEMIGFARENNIKLIVDASHPYALEVSKNAREAARNTGIEYLRFSRPKTKIDQACYVDSMDACLNLLKGISGTVFFTTGSSSISEFEKVRGDNRFIYRVLPTVESMEICRQAGIALKNMIGVLGPFSLEMNQAMFREYAPAYVVMKNSGQQGGTEEKLEACRSLGIAPIILERDEENGFNDLDLLIETIMNRIKHHESK